MTSTDHRPSTAIGSRRRNQRFVGGVAAGSTLGLALAQVVVNLAQLPADAGLGPLAGPVLTPAVAALLLSGTAVLAIAGRTPPGVDPVVDHHRCRPDVAASPRHRVLVGSVVGAAPPPSGRAGPVGSGGCPRLHRTGPDAAVRCASIERRTTAPRDRTSKPGQCGSERPTSSSARALSPDISRST
jgi:hypothetical protein